jgi:hypothetical protein
MLIQSIVYFRLYEHDEGIWMHDKHISNGIGYAATLLINGPGPWDGHICTCEAQFGGMD